MGTAGEAQTQGDKEREKEERERGLEDYTTFPSRILLLALATKPTSRSNPTSMHRYLIHGLGHARCRSRLAWYAVLF
jgi:hypothetical protein